MLSIYAGELAFHWRFKFILARSQKTHVVTTSLAHSDKSEPTQKVPPAMRSDKRVLTVQDNGCVSQLYNYGSAATKWLWKHLTLTYCQNDTHFQFIVLFSIYIHFFRRYFSCNLFKVTRYINIYIYIFRILQRISS